MKYTLFLFFNNLIENISSTTNTFSDNLWWQSYKTLNYEVIKTQPECGSLSP